MSLVPRLKLFHPSPSAIHFAQRRSVHRPGPPSAPLFKQDPRSCYLSIEDRQDKPTWAAVFSDTDSPTKNRPGSANWQPDAPADFRFRWTPRRSVRLEIRSALSWLQRFPKKRSKYDGHIFKIKNNNNNINNNTMLKFANKGSKQSIPFIYRIR